MENIPNGVPIVRPVDLVTPIIGLSGLKRISSTISDAYQRTILRGGEILFCVRGSVGKIAISSHELNGANVTRGISPIRFDSDVVTKYVFYHLQSFYSLSEIKRYSKGATLQQINVEDLKKISIAFPSIAEQKRIVESIEHWLSLVDSIEENKDNLQATIKQAKSKVLDLAFHGKLVPQDPTDEPASELLKRINPKAEIACDNPHYRNLPKGWAVIKVGNVAKYTNGRAFKPEEWESIGLPIIRIQNLNDADAPYNRSSVIHEQKYLVKDGDLLFAWAASIGTYLWSGGDAWLNQHIFKVEPYPFIEKTFLFYAFQAMISEFYKNSHGSGMVHITKKQFEEITLLLPPLSEQFRIVECLEQTFSILDSINCNL